MSNWEPKDFAMALTGFTTKCDEKDKSNPLIRFSSKEIQAI